jgi:hypothetical protein
MSEDFEQKMKDAAGELLSQVAAGEICAEDAQREVDICKALVEMTLIMTDMGRGHVPLKSICVGRQR